MKLSRREIGSDLPQIIVKTDSSLAFFPKSDPTWHVEIDEVNIAQVYRGQRALNQ
jgi:hypothetical protein